MNKFLLLPGILLVLVGCGGEKKQDAAKETAEVAHQQFPADAPPAQVTVEVHFTGTPVRGERIRMNADPRCEAMHQHDIFPHPVRVSADGKLRDAFVYVKEGLGGRSFPTPTEPVVLDQKGCMYEPRVLGLLVNQTLKIKNSDPTLHNVNAVARQNRAFNIAQPVQGMVTERKFDRTEIMIPVKCDVHPWMSSYIGVLNHPFFGVSGENGIVELKDLPPGEYVIAVWHERLGTQETRVAVQPGETKTIEVQFTQTAS